MASKLLNRAKMSVSGSPGTGAFTLSTAATGYQSFGAAGALDGDTIPYIAEGAAGVEVGFGTYATSGTSLARTTILFSTNGNAAVDFGADVVVSATALAADLGGGKKIIDRRKAQYTTIALLTAQIPQSDAVPTSAQGTQVLSLAVTTTSAAQIVALDFTAFGTASSSVNIAYAIFRDGVCIAAAAAGTTTNLSDTFRLALDDAPGAAGTYTYTVRIGPTASWNFTLNGGVNARWFGGKAATTLFATVIE